MPILRARRGSRTLSGWKTRDRQKQERPASTASAILDGTIVEMLHRPDLCRTLFATYSAGRWMLQDAVDIGDEQDETRAIPG
jgi:hypothetical protein